MFYYGNVVRFRQRPKELYVIKDCKYDGQKLDSIALMPFDHCNTSTHISRKSPLKRSVLVSDDCKAGTCDHWASNDSCPTEYEDSPIFNIYEIEYVADCVTDFIRERFDRLMFE